MRPPASRRKLELPPTAGLPALPGDLFRRPAESFAEGLRRGLNLPELLMTCSGTAALVVALTALRQGSPGNATTGEKPGWEKGRTKVIIPAYTCPLVPLAVELAGLHSVVCDTLAGGIDFDPERLAALCDEQTLAVLPTHLGGRVADVETAQALAARCGALVVEDAAQALGAKNQGRSVGLCGDAAFFSLAVGKGLTSYEGGVLFSHDPVLTATLRHTAERLLRPKLFWTLRRNLEWLAYLFFYRPSRLWTVYGRPLAAALAQGDEVRAVGDDFTLDDIPLHSLDPLRLRVLANALPRLDGHLSSGQERAAGRLKILRKLEGLSLVDDRPGTEGVWPFFMLLMPTRKQRDQVLRELWLAGLGVSRLFIHALPDYPGLSPSLSKGPYAEADCPNARDFAARMLTLSNTPWMDNAVFLDIVATLRRAL